MPFSCLACKHPRFPTLDALRSHYDATHTWCITCKTPFPTASDLSTHAHAHPYPCTACFRCFATSAGLADHRATASIHVHGDPELVQRRRGWLGTSPFYGCGLCDAQYQVMHQLAHHRRVVHAGLVREGGQPSSRRDGSVRMTGTEDVVTSIPSGSIQQPTRADDTPRPLAKTRKKGKKAPTQSHTTTHPASSAHPPTVNAAPVPLAPQPTHVTARRIPTQPPTPKKRKKGNHRSAEGEVMQEGNVDAAGKTPEMQQADGDAAVEASTMSAGVSCHPPSADPADPPTTRKRRGTFSGVVPSESGHVRNALTGDASGAGFTGREGRLDDSRPSIPVDPALAATRKKRKRSKARPEDAKSASGDVVGLPARTASDAGMPGTEGASGHLPMVAAMNDTVEAEPRQSLEADIAPTTPDERSKTRHAPAARLHPLLASAAPPPPPARPAISANDIADAGAFLAQVHHRLRAHPETLAQLMALFNTPERMRDVQGVSPGIPHFRVTEKGTG